MDNKTMFKDTIIGLVIIFILPIIFGVYLNHSKDNKKDIEDISKVPELKVDELQGEKIEDMDINIKEVEVFLSDNEKTVNIQIEEYVKGVVSGEMPVSFEEDALKAQAILARTFVVNKKIKHCTKAGDADICDSTHCQVYKSLEQKKKQWGEKGDQYFEKIEKAVKDTEGQILSYDGYIVKYPQYFSTSSGKTEEGKYVFADVPYLKSVDSPGEEGAPKYKSTKTLTHGKFINIINKNLPSAKVTNNNLSKQVKILNRNPGDTVNEVQVGLATIKGTEFRKILGLNSANFRINIDNKNVEIDCLGYGHDVGMSQWGANVMAKEGKSSDEILKHYYSGCKIINISEALIE